IDADEQHADDSHRRQQQPQQPPRAASLRLRRARTHDAARLGATAAPPGYDADSPNTSSMRSNWLYFATRSDRAGAPALICPQLVATARSEIVVSSVSPDRWDITAV